ncbi:MAG: hypothetical protein H0Z32_11395 [Bacillaceae bacterium]|nr:hypothetical protein [Bacillaceae bacterium]
MAENCFYCGNDLHQQDMVHFVSFFRENNEQEHPLCDECYSEWLEGMKG